MTNKRKILRQIILMTGFFLLLFVSMIAGAETGLTVSVRPILPENQHNKQSTYYDLRMVPGKEQDLELELTNTSDKEQKVLLQINDATTTDDGEIDYSDRTAFIKRDKSLKISIKDIATADSELIIPAKQKIMTKVHLKMPDTSFNGMILGGIKVISTEKNSKQSASDNETDDKDDKIYIVAVKITESDTPVEASLQLLDVTHSKKSKKQVIQATIQNNQAVNLENIEYRAEIYKKNSEKILHKVQVTDYRMAPNSSFKFIIDMKKKSFQAGKYQLRMVAESKDTGQSWKWDKEFEVASVKEKKRRTFMDSPDKESIMLYTILCTGTFVLLLIILLILLILRKRKENQYKAEIYYRKKKRKNKPNVQRNKRPKGPLKKDRVRKKQGYGSKGSKR